MAKKLRTGFELPISNTATNSYRLVHPSDNILGSNIINGSFARGQNMNGTRYPSNFGNGAGSENIDVYFNSSARSKRNNLGCYISGSQGNGIYLSLDETQLSNGVYTNFHILSSNFATNIFPKHLHLYDGTDRYFCYLENSTGLTILHINKNNVDLVSLTLGGSKLANNTWYNVLASVDNSGLISYSVNGSTPITYNTGVTFSNWTLIGLASTDPNYQKLDDLAINDGSGSSDNGIPSSIRAYNFFDQATLDTQTGFSSVGGSTILANLTDGDDATRVTATNDLSEMNFSLPSLSASGMSETASNFSKIEAINIYARQIEATKANSVLKAKIIDSVTNANREENISLPLTVANQSTTMFDDGSNDFSLSNLDSGNLDLKITFDKP